MQISTETVGRLLASGRGYAQYFVGFATSLGLLSAANSKGLIDGFNDIFNGITQMFHGFTSVWQIAVVVLAPVGSIFLARWSSNSAKTSSQAASVQAAVKDPNSDLTLAAKASILDAAAKLPEVSPDTKIKVEDSKLAAAVPDSKVVTR